MIIIDILMTIISLKNKKTIKERKYEQTKSNLQIFKYLNLPLLSLKHH